MDKQEAFNVISQVCVAYKGDLKEHNLIQNALRILTPEPVKPKPVKEVKSVNQTGGITAKTVNTN